MARLQDFPSVTPTSSDKILIVQSQSQGLAPHTIKMDSANPTGTGSLSINRKSGTTIGTNSVTLGNNCEASGALSFASGITTKASGDNGCVAEGNSTTSSGRCSHSAGLGTTANHRSQFAFGEYNIADASTAASTARGNYVEIVGNGTSTTPSNARTLDWSGNETIAGTLTQSSDAKLKDVKDEAIPDVSAIKAVRFTWKEDANRDDAEHIGYLAQDVEKVLPFLVKEDAEGNKVLDYIAFLVAKVDSLEKRISELEKGE